jgi:hypothetical protein
MDKHFELSNDIDLDGYFFQTAVIAPYKIPDKESGISPFSGTFDGKGFCIWNLMVDGSARSYSYLGLFGQADSGAEIRNLGLENCFIKTTLSGYPNVAIYVGSFVGYNRANITSSYATGSVIGGDNAGGLVGVNAGVSVISNCYASVDVNGNYSCGGLAGSNSGTISNSYTSGSVNAHLRLGGITADMGINGNVLNCFYLDTIESENSCGLPLTDIQMKQQASFVGWDFVNVWDINEGLSYPYLFWQNE